MMTAFAACLYTTLASLMNWIAPRLPQLCLALGLMAPLPVFAQAGAECKPGGTLEQVNACAVREFQQADTDIQLLYGDVIRIQSAHERPALRKEQTAWMRDREARCRQETAAQQSRPEWPRLLHQCLTRETKARRAGLMRWMSVDGPGAAQ